MSRWFPRTTGSSQEKHLSFDESDAETDSEAAAHSCLVAFAPRGKDGDEAASKTNTTGSQHQAQWRSYLVAAHKWLTVLILELRPVSDTVSMCKNMLLFGL